MKKNALLLLVLFGGGLLFTTLCSLSGDVTHQSHEAFCASGHPHDVFVNGTVSLFALFFVGFFLPVNTIFVPQKFVYSLFKPPQSV